MASTLSEEIQQTSNHDLQMQQSVEEVWVEPGPDAKRIVWRYYKRSNWKHGKTNRYRAKCNFCDRSFDGKVQRMEAHLLNDCVKVVPSAKSALINEYSSKKTTDESDEEGKYGSVTKFSEPVSLYQGLKRKINDKGTTSCCNPIITCDKPRHNLTLTLVKSFVSGNVPFAFTEDYYFQEFIHALNPSWKLPTISTIVDNYYSQLYAWANDKRDKRLTNLDMCTLTLNGWSDLSHDSIFAFVAMYGHDRTEILDIVDFSHKRHTAEIILGEAEKVITESVIPIGKIKCVVTESPNTLIKFRTELCAKYPHIIGLPCVLDVSNVLAKDICKQSEALEVVKKNFFIINYFTASQIWNAELKLWMKNKNITYSLETLCDTRWCFIAKLCYFVQIFQSFFEYAIQKVDDSFPKVPKEVELCMDQNHFNKNSSLLEVLEPVADVIDVFETRKINLADIIVQYARLYLRYNVMKDGRNENKLIYHALMHLSKRCSMYFTEPIYFIALFLYPKYKKFSISKKFSLLYMKKEILTLAKLWGSNKEKCIRLNQDITNYHNDDQAASLELQPIMYWNSTTKYSELRYFANCVFKFKGHGVSSEVVFSGSMSTKTTCRSEMNAENFKMFYIIRAQLRESIPERQAKTKMPRTAAKAPTAPDDSSAIALEQNRSDESAMNAIHDRLSEQLKFVLLDDEDYTSYRNRTYDHLYIKHLFDYNLLEPLTSDFHNLQTDEVNPCMNFSIEDILEL